MEVSYNTRLPVVSQKGGATLIATPTDGEKWVASEEIAVFQTEQDIPKTRNHRGNISSIRQTVFSVTVSMGRHFRIWV